MHFPWQYVFFERAVDFSIYFYYNKDAGSPIFNKILDQNQFAGDFL